MIIEISHLIHVLSLRGTGNGITFCWLPSHCGFYFNEKVDKAAKAGAENSLTSIEMTIPYSLQECYSLLENAVWEKNRNVKQIQNNFQYADEAGSRKVIISKHKKVYLVEM